MKYQSLWQPASQPLCRRMLWTVGVVSLVMGCGDGDTSTGRRTRDAGAIEERDADAEREEDDSETSAPLSPEQVRDAIRDFVDAAVTTWPRPQPLDAGVLLDAPALAPLLDAALADELLGKAYAEVEYELMEPAALAKAFAGLASASNDTRLFVTELVAADAGAQARYGAADRVDGGLVWQKPPAKPRSFDIGRSPTAPRTLVSKPFQYVLEARVAASAGAIYRLYLEAAQSIWSATFNPDATEIVSGELRGVLTREEVEHRPLDLLACAASCSSNRASYCRADRELHLSVAFDCNAAQPDVDTDADGVADGYRLTLAFSSQQVTPPRE